MIVEMFFMQVNQLRDSFAYRINLPRQLDGLQMETYLIAFLLSLAFLGFAWIISNSIPFDPQGKDPGKRRTWFIILGLAAMAIFFCYNYFYVSTTIRPIPILTQPFTRYTLIGVAIVVVEYFGAGFVLSKALKNSKFGSIFPSKK